MAAQAKLIVLADYERVIGPMSSSKAMEKALDMERLANKCTALLAKQFYQTRMDLYFRYAEVLEKEGK